MRRGAGQQSVPGQHMVPTIRKWPLGRAVHDTFLTPAGDSWSTGGWYAIRRPAGDRTSRRPTMGPVMTAYGLDGLTFTVSTEDPDADDAIVLEVETDAKPTMTPFKVEWTR